MRILHGLGSQVARQIASEACSPQTRSAKPKPNHETSTLPCWGRHVSRRKPDPVASNGADQLNLCWSSTCHGGSEYPCPVSAPNAFKATLKFLDELADASGEETGESLHGLRAAVAMTLDDAFDVDRDLTKLLLDADPAQAR